MQVKTGVRAGITPQQLVQNVGNTAGKAVKGVDEAAQGASKQIQRWWYRSNAGDALNKAFWWPLDPPS